MAELGISRNRKAAPKVDLTAMVDLAFLLITFFMLTTSLSKPIAMDVAKPDEGELNNWTELPASRTMTILLAKNNKVAWYMGVAGENSPQIEDYHGIRKSILANASAVAAANANDPKKSIVVIIKPTAGASYKNFVDILDELNVSKIKTAPAIDDDHITGEELEFLKQHNL
jgi:biopolymer transport protein ExbD